MTRMAKCHPERRHMAHDLCASCHTAAWQRKNEGKVKSYQKKYQQKLVNDPEKRKMNLTRKRRYGLEQKQRVVDLLGGKCAMCGLDDIRVLQVDHIGGYANNPGGARGNALRNDILAGREDLDNLQILCANCHMIKTYYLEDEG